jgi:hypothetical protein
VGFSLCNGKLLHFLKGLPDVAPSVAHNTEHGNFRVRYGSRDYVETERAKDGDAVGGKPPVGQTQLKLWLSLHRYPPTSAPEPLALLNKDLHWRTR